MTKKEKVVDFPNGVPDNYTALHCDISDQEGNVCGTVKILHRDYREGIVNVLEIFGPGKRLLVSVNNQGVVEMAKGTNADEAATLFWAAIAEAFKKFGQIEASLRRLEQAPYALAPADARRSILH